MKPKYEAGPGQHIDAACREAVAFAKLHGPQEFMFNGVTVLALADDNPEELSAKWSDHMEAARIAYQQSPEGIAYAREREERVARLQEKHDGLMLAMPDVLTDRRDSLVRWLSDYAEVADDIGVKKDFATVIDQLEGVGYSANEATGLPKSEYEKPAIMCAYIVGHALSCMKKGMPPHPMTLSFVERYFKLIP